MLTINEATERAKAIWGGEAFNIQLRPDGGADVDTLTDTAVSLSRYHRLDANGHIACHVECAERESELTPLTDD